MGEAPAKRFIVMLLASAAPALGQSVDPTVAAELEAAAAIGAYYQETTQRVSNRSVQLTGQSKPRPPSCEGVSLRECFGGDVWCAWRASWCDPTPFVLERAALRERLDSLGSAASRSGYIVGQAVDFAIKDGDIRGAFDRAAACEAAEWWCVTLRAFVLFEAGAPDRAAAAVDSALGLMPPEEPAFDGAIPEEEDRGLACEWSDVQPLLDDEWVEDYLAAPCGPDNPVARRYWFLSDPLWSTPGNERRAEHVIRLARMRLHWQAELAVRDESEREPDIRRSFWPRALRDEVVRNGFSNSWRTITIPDGAGFDERVELYASGGYGFGALDRLLADPETSAQDEWDVHWDEGHDRSLRGVEWHNLTDYQAGTLLRGDSIQVVVAGLSPRLGVDPEGVVASLAMADPDRLSTRLSSGTVSPNGVLKADITTPAGSWVASLELTGDDWVGRTRHGVVAPSVEPDGFGLSVPILVSSGDVSDVRLEILPSTRVPQGDVGVYFEVYGEPGDEAEIDISMSLEREGRSLFGSLLGLFGIGGGSGSAAASWTGQWSPGQDAYTPYSFAMDLSGLEPGAYEMVVEVETRDGRKATTRRDLVLIGTP